MTHRPTHMSDDLLASYLLNEASDEQRSVVENWIIETADNRRYFEHFKLIWETSHNIELPATVDENAAWERFRQRITKPPQKVFALTKLWAAATIVVCVGLAALTYMAWQKTTDTPVTLAANEKAVNQELPDGSIVTLNKHSSIEYTSKFKGNQRNVRLRGEGFFKVTPDIQKPFVVQLESVTVTVVGTAFNINETKDATEVIVESGIVKVQSGADEVLLHPGEKISVRKNSRLPQPQKTKDQLYNYYVTKQFVCDDTPLWKLVEALNEAYNADIKIANDDVAKLPLTTTFQDEPLENILLVISETFNLTVEHKGNSILLK